jgi:hypothetical protein
MKGIEPGEDCLVMPTGLGRKHEHGKVLEAYDKAYFVQLVDGTKKRVSAAKVKPVRVRAKTAALEPMPEQEESEAPVYREPVAQPKTQTRFVYDPYRRYVKSHRCVNCEFHGAVQHGNTEADHRGERGVSQKCSDLLVIPLCMFCHAVITAKNVLPVRPKGLSDPAKTPQLMSVVDTHLIVTGAQMKLLTGIVNALAQSDPDAAIKALEGGLRNLDKDTLAEACKMAMKEDE